MTRDKVSGDALFILKSLKENTRLGRSNKLADVKALVHSSEVANHDDARVQKAMTEIRKAGDSHPYAVAPVSANANDAAKQLLEKLSSGDKILSGRAEGLQGANTPVILSVDAAKLSDATTQTVKGGVLKLNWRPLAPNGATTLSAGEWSQLLTPGSELNVKWQAEVDEIAAKLDALQKANVAVLFAPLPGMDGKAAWWAGHSGPTGAQALWRQLFVELTEKRGLKNLVWLYESDAAPEWNFEYGGAFHDNFPGLLYVDAMQLDVPTYNWSYDLERPFFVAATGKPVGIGVVDKFAEADKLFGSSYWKWFVVEKSSQADDALYASPRVEHR